MTDPLRGVRAFDRRHPLWWDLGLATLVALISYNAGPGLGPLGLAIFTVVHVAVAFHRRRPFIALLVAFVGIVVATVGTLLTGAPPPWLYLAIWVLLFGTAMRESRRTVIATASVIMAIVTAFALIAPPDVGLTESRERISLAVAVVGMSTASFLLGLQLRGRRDRLAAEQAEIARAAAVAERSRLAQEMHDVIGHNLSVITSLSAGGTVAARTSPDDAVRAFEAIGEVSRSSVREVHRVLSVLRHDASADGAPLSPQPGLSDLAPLLDAMRGTGMEVVLRQSGDLGGLDTGRQLAVYRIVQESLTNVLRHAGQRARASVGVAREPDAVVVTVSDNGVGTAPTTAKGHGILGMRERVEAYGGGFEAGPTVSGWRVWARIPLEDTAWRKRSEGR
ncbi:sensor histidine kinase [Microbacterium halotolerans]|uniref:sensor histidine kinase n=1 Tax=Microbacterium halotolerans TaxID=246613 RepID=UPI000E6AB204|nr:histidine kinase [Microbacterium halotolerans]